MCRFKSCSETRLFYFPLLFKFSTYSVRTYLCFSAAENVIKFCTYSVNPNSSLSWPCTLFFATCFSIQTASSVYRISLHFHPCYHQKVALKGHIITLTTYTTWSSINVVSHVALTIPSQGSKKQVKSCWRTSSEPVQQTMIAFKVGKLSSDRLLRELVQPIVVFGQKSQQQHIRVNNSQKRLVFLA